VTDDELIDYWNTVSDPLEAYRILMEDHGKNQQYLLFYTKDITEALLHVVLRSLRAGAERQPRSAGAWVVEDVGEYIVTFPCHPLPQMHDELGMVYPTGTPITLVPGTSVYDCLECGRAPVVERIR